MAVAGVRGTGNWATSQRPTGFRETILYINPNGDVPLTGLSSKLSSRSLDDPQWTWFTKPIDVQRLVVTVGATDSGTSVTVSDNAEITRDGTVMWNYNTGERMRSAADGNSGTNVVDITDRSVGATAAAAVAVDDVLIITGTSHAENAIAPTSITFDTSTVTNYTQIHRTPMSISRTARKTRLRTGDAYQQLKYDILEQHAQQLERCLFFGEQAAGSGSTPERLSDGLAVVATTNTINVGNFTKSQMWDYLEQAFRYGSMEKIGFGGSGAIRELAKFAHNSGSLQIEPGTTEVYGMKLKRMTTNFGDLLLYRHPLLTDVAETRNWLIICDMAQLEYGYLDDTMFLTRRMDDMSRDGTVDEFLTECTLIYGHEQTHAVFQNVNGWTGN